MKLYTLAVLKKLNYQQNYKNILKLTILLLLMSIKLIIYIYNLTIFQNPFLYYRFEIIICKIY